MNIVMLFLIRLFLLPLGLHNLDVLEDLDRQTSLKNQS